MHILEQRYSVKDVARATGLPTRTISDWANRGYVLGQSGGGIQGKDRSFSFGNLMEISIGSYLVKEFDFTPKNALRLSLVFSHSGDFNREMGVPFKDGFTLLIVDGSNHTRLIETETGEINLFEINRLNSRFTNLIVVNISQIFADTLNRLGLDSRDVLDEIDKAKAQ